VERASARSRRAQAGRELSPADLKRSSRRIRSSSGLPDAFLVRRGDSAHISGEFKKSALRERFKDYRLAEEAKT